MRDIDRDTVIDVVKLSKRYRIGALQIADKSLGEGLVEALIQPFRLVYSVVRRNRPGPSEDEFIWALKDVSFQVQRGEVVGIIGHNGAGKSTLLKVLTRITFPTEGYARIRGRVGSLLEVGTGFQGMLTGRENTYLNGAFLGMTKSEIDAKFDEIVEFSGVEKFIDTPVRHYSSGMYLRLAFAVAAHLEPDILLVDEVLAVGDAAFQRKCLGKMKDVTYEGRTVLFVSHNMLAIQQLCERALLMEQGGVIMDNTAASVIDTYLKMTDDDQGETTDIAHAERHPSVTRDDIRFTRFTLVDDEGIFTNRVKYGDTLRFYIEARSKIEMDGLTIAMQIETRDQFTVTTILGEEYDVEYSASPDEPLRVRLDLDHMTLRPGTYRVTILAIRQRIGLPDDRVENPLVFEVLPLRSEDSLTLGRGLLTPKVSWRAVTPELAHSVTLES
ncbi:MAG: ABC transporter ATP-binding protein [Anaerolineae bacterium]|nr:ABC transporter ATP-binding protein [Anaerolineae bacterium]